MSRSVPWRSKPTNLITQMLPVSNELKLYLVNEIGPTSFQFKDDMDNKFKVVIGSTISCSCGVVHNDHCIHTLYVMLKKYKVPPTNPIIWQASYLDSELEGLIHLKYMEKKKQQTKKYIPKKKMEELGEEEDFPPIGEDDACPICYENLEGNCYSTCGTCHKSIHSKCLKVWVLHKEDNKSKVTCPMCRAQFHNPLGMVYRDLQKWQMRFSTHKGINCRTCGVKNIKGLLYRCMICENTHLCKMCYEGNQHIDHEYYFVKQLSTSGWKLAPVRIKKSRKQLFYPIKQLQVKQLSTVPSNEFVINILPTLKDYVNSQNINELGIVGNDITRHMCFKCKSTGNQYMRRLYCGHSVHEECLKYMFDNQEYCCQIDGEIICPGYWSAMGVKVEKKKDINVNCKFITNEDEKNRLNAKLAENTKGTFRNLSIEENVPKKENKKSMSKDRNFRIMKKAVIDRRQIQHGIQSPMMIMGLGKISVNPQIPKSRPVFNRNT